MEFPRNADRVTRSTCALGAMIGMLLLSVPLFSQGNYGRILGVVTDQSGGVIPGATITITDKDRGVARTLTTDDAGEYNAPQLVPGTYTVRAEANGFKKLDRENVVLGVGRDVRVDLTVQPGTQEQTVTVSEAIPLVETTNASLGGTLQNSDINDLPLNGRNYQSLLSLRPGVMTQKGGSPWTQSTNNVRPDESTWMLDGLLSVNAYDSRPIAGAAGFFTDSTTILPLDAIQEFNLIENPKAEYGGKPGAVVNAGVRSGTNTIHGSAYAFGRDGSWDARNLFNPAPQPVQPVQLEQFGASIGGPIKKDKLFYFANYEGARSFLGTPLPTTVPETASQVNNPVPGCPAGQSGDCLNSSVDAIIALQNAGIPVSSLSKTLLGCPAGTLTTTSTCTGGFIQEPSAGANNTTTSYVSNIPLTNTSDNGIAKIDYRINDKNMINGTFYKGYYTGIGQDFPMVNTIWANTDIEQGWSLSGNWIYTLSSNWVNELRLGYTRFGFSISPNDLNKVANGTDYPINTGTGAPGFPFIKIANFGSELGGRDGRPSGTSPNPYLEFQDNVSYLRGKHAFKFGIEASRIEGDNFVNDQRGNIQFQGAQNSNAAFLCPPPNPTGASCSSPLEDFFAGLPSFAFQNIGSPNYQVTWHSLSAFFQDDWRIAPKVMLNLGMRYSYYSPFHEKNNHLGNFDPNSPAGIVQQGEPSVGDTIWKPDRGNWSPRLGLAWDVTGKGTTVVRAGAGIFYSLYSLAWIADWSTPGASTSIAADPAGACTTAVSVGTPCPQTFGGTLVDGTAQIPAASLTWNGPRAVFPTGLTLSCTAAAPCSIGAVDPHLKTPYMVDWNLGAEHSFTNNLSLDVSYVGNHGGHLLGIIDVNQAAPGTAIGSNPGIRPYSAKFPWLQYINEVVNDALSNYNSLQATLTERASHGLDFTVGYTYGHGLDNGSINRFGNPPQNSFDPQAEYASSDYDVRHRATFTAGYEIPGKKGFGQMLEGWRLNSIVTLQSGQPWTVIDGSNNFAGEGENDGRWDFFGNPSDFKVTSSSFPFCSGFPADFLSSGGADLTGVTCSEQSGVSGISTQLPASMASACKVAPNITTLTAATGGCYVSRNGQSVIVPPATNTYGTMGRGIFRDTGFKNVDFSIFKNFSFKERFNATFRVEFFNFFNHPILANPYSFSTGNNPAGSTSFGCGCATPDVAAGNSIVGSGAPRDLQLGFKLSF